MEQKQQGGRGTDGGRSGPQSGRPGIVLIAQILWTYLSKSAFTVIPGRASEVRAQLLGVVDREGLCKQEVFS